MQNGSEGKEEYEEEENQERHGADQKGIERPVPLQVTGGDQEDVPFTDQVPAPGDDQGSRSSNHQTGGLTIVPPRFVEIEESGFSGRGDGFYLFTCHGVV